MTRMRSTITWEYDADPADYPTDDAFQMAALDGQNDPVEELALAADAGADIEYEVQPV